MSIHGKRKNKLEKEPIRGFKNPKIVNTQLERSDYVYSSMNYTVTKTIFTFVKDASVYVSHYLTL